MKNVFLIFALFIFSSIFADARQIEELIQAHNYDEAKLLLEKNPAQNIELWRNLGYSYKENNEFEKAIFCYEKVLAQNSEDYDARLALARLYLTTNLLVKSRKYFQQILDNDKTDVEAYLGLARIEKAEEKYALSIRYYRLALKYLPKNIPIILEIADVYLDSDKLDSALDSYQKILKIDDTWSEAWSGIGKIYWWKNQPFKAMQYYEKALELDPQNKEISNQLRDIKESIKWNFSTAFSFQKESEETYQIKSYNQKYQLKKRFNDIFSLQAVSFWQYADKDENSLTTKRYYDSSYLKSNLSLRNFKLNCSVGGSLTDSTLTVIDAGFGFNFEIKNLKLENNLNFGNEYFYYWQKVRRDYLKENLYLNFGKISFQANYQIGKVEKNYILDKETMSENTFLDYSFSLKYKIKKLPDLSIGTVYRFIDYAYYSSLYYSPIDRSIYGFTGSLYQPFGKFYLYLDGSANQDNNEIYETNYDAEIGVSIKKYSVSISYSAFENKYYQSNTLSLTLSGEF